VVRWKWLPDQYDWEAQQLGGGAIYDKSSDSVALAGPKVDIRGEKPDEVSQSPI